MNAAIHGKKKNGSKNVKDKFRWYTAAGASIDAAKLVHCIPTRPEVCNEFDEVAVFLSLPLLREITL